MTLRHEHDDRPPATSDAWHHDGFCGKYGLSAARTGSLVSGATPTHGVLKIPDAAHAGLRKNGLEKSR